MHLLLEMHCPEGVESSLTPYVARVRRGALALQEGWRHPSSPRERRSFRTQAPHEARADQSAWWHRAHGLELPAVAIAFAALPVCVTRIVLGIGTAEQVAANLRWVEQSADVPAVLWSEAKAAGLLDASVPTPPCVDGAI